MFYRFQSDAATRLKINNREQNKRYRSRDLCPKNCSIVSMFSQYNLVLSVGYLQTKPVHRVKMLNYFIILLVILGVHMVIITNRM